MWLFRCHLIVIHDFSPLSHSYFFQIQSTHENGGIIAKNEDPHAANVCHVGILLLLYQFTGKPHQLYSR